MNLPVTLDGFATGTRLLSGKSALIIGASRGIGASTAEALVGAGALVVLASRDLWALEQLAANLTARGGKVAVKQTDIVESASVADAVAFTVDHFGSLDVAINNAGMLQESMPLADVSDEMYDRVMNINARGVFVAMKHEIRAMLAGGRGGAIVNTASVGGLVGRPNRAAYVASKHALIGLTKAAALDYAKDGIRVNAVAPGAIRTDMMRDGASAVDEERLKASTPLGRIGDSAEVASAILWLCSDAASYVTGVTFPVDGGRTIT